MSDQQQAASHKPQAQNSNPRGSCLACSLLLAFCCLFPVLASSQSASGHKSDTAQKQQAPAHSATQPASSPQSHQPGINEEFSAPLAAESKTAAHENSQEKMVEELKHSPSVRSFAGYLHLSPNGGYWVGIFFDFAILALLIAVMLKKNLPSMFRTRTQSIQRGILEARKASEEANRRLAEIEARLGKLDAEIAALRTAAEQETATEEKRIQAAAELDARRMLENAAAEIAAAAKVARRELKAFTADLAVGLAERRIQVDAPTDQEIVRAFTRELAGANAPGAGSAGRDGE